MPAASAPTFVGGGIFVAPLGGVIAASICSAAHGTPGAVAHVAAGAPTPGAGRSAQPPITRRALAAPIQCHADGAARHHRAGNLIAEIIVGLLHATADEMDTLHSPS